MFRSLQSFGSGKLGKEGNIWVWKILAATLGHQYINVPNAFLPTLVNMYHLKWIRQNMKISIFWIWIGFNWVFWHLKWSTPLYSFTFFLHFSWIISLLDFSWMALSISFYSSLTFIAPLLPCWEIFENIFYLHLQDKILSCNLLPNFIAKSYWHI